MSGVLASGTIYIDRLSALGAYTGLTQWPGSAKLEITPNSDLVELTSKDKGKYGQITMSVAVNKPADFALTVNDITGKQLAAALQGSVNTLSQGSGTLSAVSFTAYKGAYVDLGKYNLASSGFSVTNSAASVTYVLGTDYTIDYSAGLLYIIPAGAITDAQVIKVTATYNAVSGEKVLGATDPSVKGLVQLDGVNLADNKPLRIRIWDAVLTADGAVDFLSDNPIALSMKGRMNTPAGKSSPFEIDYGLTYS